MRFKASTCEPLAKHKCWFAVDDDELNKENLTPLTVHQLARRIVTELSLAKKASDVTIELDGFELRPTALVRGLLREGDLILVRKALKEETHVSKKRKAAPEPVIEKQDDKKQKKSKKKEGSQEEKGLSRKHPKRNEEPEKKKVLERKHLVKRDIEKKKAEKKETREKKKLEKKEAHEKRKSKEIRDKKSDKDTNKTQKKPKTKRAEEKSEDKEKKGKADKKGTDKRPSNISKGKKLQLKQSAHNMEDAIVSETSGAHKGHEAVKSSSELVTPPHQGSKRTQRRNARKKFLKSLFRNPPTDNNASQQVQIGDSTIESTDQMLEEQDESTGDLYPEEEPSIERVFTEVIEPQHYAMQNRNKKKNFLKEINKTRKHIQFSNDDLHEDDAQTIQEQDEVHTEDHGSAFVTSIDAAYGSPVDHTQSMYRKYPVHNARVVYAKPRHEESFEVQSDTMIEETVYETAADSLLEDVPTTIIARNYDDYPAMDFTSPDLNVGDHLAVKIFQLSAMYTPEISDWKEVKLMDIDRVNRSLVVEYLHGFSADTNKGGKFDLTAKEGEYDDEEEDEEERVFTYGEGDIVQMIKIA